MSGYANNLSTGLVATQVLQIAIGSLAKFGANNLSGLAKASSKQMNGYSNNIGKGIEETQTLQTAIDSLAKFGSRNLMGLAKASSKAMNGLVNNFRKGIEAAHDLARAINAIPSGGGGGFEMAQTGMHKSLQQDTLILAHKGERVDIGPQHGTSTGAFRVASDDGSGMSVINFRIAGNDIINERTLTRRIKGTVGRNRDRFG